MYIFGGVSEDVFLQQVGTMTPDEAVSSHFLAKDFPEGNKLDGSVGCLLRRRPDPLSRCQCGDTSPRRTIS